jgi:hypothetical protein
MASKAVKKNVNKIRNQLLQISQPGAKLKTMKPKRLRAPRRNVVGPSPSKTISKGRNRGTLGLSSKPSGATSRRMQTISEDEYIGEINGSVGFATTSYPCNPGQASLLPWGNKIATLYEEYDFTQLEFYYKREVSEYATQGTTGKVMLSFDYDASDLAPTTKQQVMDTVPHVDGMPSDPVIRLKIDCSRIRKNSSKYVRPGAQPANTDIKTYDAGNLYVSTYGNQNTTNLGELRVKYTLKLSEPVLEPASVVGGVAHFSGTAGTTANNFATAALQAGATVSLQTITLGTNTVIFPAGIPGNYLLAFSIAGATSASAVGLSSFGNATALSLFTTSATRDNNSSVGSLAGTTTSPAMISCSLSVPTGGATVTYSPGTIVGAGSWDLFIISLPSTVLTVVNPADKVMEDRIAALERMLRNVNVDEKFVEEDFLVCPICDVVKITLPFDGCCSSKCLKHRAFVKAKDNLIHLDEETSFVRVSDNSNIFHGIPISDKDDYIVRLSPVWINVLPIPSTMPNCVDLVCRGRREPSSTTPTTKV